MRSIARPFSHLSPYPLKAVSQSNVNNNKPDSPYLRALLSGVNAGNNGNTARVRKLSLASTGNDQRKTDKKDKSRLPSDIELTEKEWFSNYE
ncbi:MAG: hypothetical protein JNK14_10725 [Chitinophagaceae bacterium]|nr:hypothetical protein [Chitinophagaceae bacterium]